MPNFFKRVCDFDDIGPVEVHHVSQGVANFDNFLIRVNKVLIMQLCDFIKVIQCFVLSSHPCYHLNDLDSVNR